MDGKIRLRVVVVHITLDVEVDTSEEVDDVGAGLHVHGDVLVDGDAEQMFRRPHDERRAARPVERADAILIGGVRDGHPGIARDRHDAQPPRLILHGEQEQRVRLPRGAPVCRLRAARAVIKPEYEHVRIAVKARVELARARLPPREIRLVSHLILRIDARTPMVERHAEETEDDEDDTKDEQEDTEAQQSQAPLAREELPLAPDILARAIHGLPFLPAAHTGSFTPRSSSSLRASMVCGWSRCPFAATNLMDSVRPMSSISSRLASRASRRSISTSG